MAIHASPFAGNDAILQFLSGLRMFEGVSRAGLTALARICRVKQAPRGTFLFFQGDVADTVFIVRRGLVALRLENPDGRELVINEMIEGDCFGELGVLTGQPHSTSAEAKVDSVVLLIPSSEFRIALVEEPRFTLHLLELTARRLQTSSKREESLAFHDAQQRLARQLLVQDKLAVDKGYLTLSQEELAQRTGLTRQTVATVLGRWRRRGLLLTGRGHIVLLDHLELERMSGE